MAVLQCNFQKNYEGACPQTHLEKLVPLSLALSMTEKNPTFPYNPGGGGGVLKNEANIVSGKLILVFRCV